MNWPQIDLQDIALQEKGAIVSGPFGSNISAKYFVDEGIPVIRGNNLTKGKTKFIDNGFAYITETKAAEFRNCMAMTDDIVFTAAGSIGQVGIIPPEARYEKYVISNKQLRVRLDKSRANPNFVFAWLSSPQMVRYLENMNNGGAVPLLNLGIIRRVPVPLPPLETQNKIAEVLSVYDDLIENNRQRIALLEEAARFLYREWFVHFRFPGHEHVRVTEGVPGGWERRELGSTLNLQRGFDLPVSRRVADGVPVYGSTGIVGEHNMAKVDSPTLITGRSGSLGRVCFVDDPCWPLNTSLWVTDFKAVSIYFAYFMLSEMDLAKFNGGVSVPTLDRKVAHAANVLIPTRNIAMKFDKHVEIMFKLKKLLSQQIQKLVQARSLLLPRLFNGQLAV
ncbi:MAG: restriction endonuclease subunit S [Rhodospirillaceae bacterium]|nr:restriction endonuclease subunit S [Rhodospirillaceae bacterium]